METKRRKVCPSGRSHPLGWGKHSAVERRRRKRKILPCQFREYVETWEKFEDYQPRCVVSLRILRCPILSTALVFILIAVHQGAAWGAYFTMPYVKLIIPYDELAEDDRLLRATAHPTDTEETLSYSLAKPSPWLRVDPTTGYLFLSPKERAKEADFNRATDNIQQVDVTATQVTPRASSTEASANSKTEKMVIHVGIIPQNKKSYCDGLRQQTLCFWDNVTFSIMENRGPTELGVMRPLFLQHLCPNHFVSYTIIRGAEDYFNLAPSPNGIWHLHTRKPFDREESDNWDIVVECKISSSEGNISLIERSIRITVLDEDDCPPIAQVTSLEENIINTEAKKGQSLNTGLLVISDADSTEVNNYIIEIQEDTIPPRILDISYRKWDLNIGKQDTPINNKGHLESGNYKPRKSFDQPSSTVIHIGVVFSKTIKLVNQSYTTSFNLKDATLKGGHGKDKVTLHIKLNIGPPKQYPKIEDIDTDIRQDYRGTGEENQRLKFDITSAYPSFLTIPVTASNFTRIAQPSIPPSLTSLNAKLLPVNSPFAITPDKGIIYLRNASLLHKNMSFTILVQWDKFQEMATINVQVTKSNFACNKGSQSMPCANKKFKRSCESSCGVGSSGYCSWREALETFPLIDYLSTHYTTCSPNSTTCPNGVCDELEELSTGICPQDCTREVFGTARQHKTENKGRGIKSATGVCSCDTYAKCSCGPVNAKTTAIPSNLSESVNFHPSSGLLPHNLHSMHEGMSGRDDRGIIDSKSKVIRYHDTCGESCYVAAALGVIATFSIALAGAMYTRKRRMVKRGQRLTSPLSTALAIAIHPHEGHNGTFAAASLGIQSQIYGHDDDNNNPQQELPLLSMNPIHQEIMPPDSKWELPREALQLEETLGEGEFGLVLKGRLTSMQRLGNQQQFTTVAVKTLKAGAGEVERGALVSEFQLLQGVNHNNVVRLIGACTIPRDQPFLLIIEYAELGSLRNYLRKCRMSDSEGAHLQRLPIERPNPSIIDSVFTVIESSSSLLTPKHILSFAWQISKGMAYLSEIKLVHRDLAARNVLLSDKGVCKISDFGLTRDVYEDEAYYKKSKGRVPVKWMAPESLSDHVYTTQSDVWGFGILLWELVTLGSSPYPGVPLAGLYSLLQSGYRMQKPANCSSELYQIMLCCWKLDHRARPSFQCLMTNLEKMLQDEVEYLHLGSVMALNLTYFNSNNDTICFPVTELDEDDEDIHNAKGLEESYGQDPQFKQENTKNVYTSGYEVPMNPPDSAEQVPSDT